MRASIQVTVALAVVLLAAAHASPAGGFGGFLGGSSKDSEEPAHLPSLPNPVKVLGSLLGGGNRKAEEHEHKHVHEHEHKIGEVPTPPPAKKAAAPDTAAPTTAAAAAPTTTTATAAPTTAGSTTAAQEASETTVAPRSPLPPSGNATLDKCRDSWMSVTNSTVSENTDILAVLLDNGGFPGQLDGQIKWERNATEGKPNRWTYFWGDTDYKTYIRAERGEINSRTPPVQGATPESLEGNVWWAPEDFCGKLRHAVYTQDNNESALEFPAAPAAPTRRPGWNIERNIDDLICTIGDSKAGKTLRCSPFLLADRAPLGPALIASLVG